ncbi:MAG: MAPEG family protein [Cellvibrio sp.]|uniref:MAPEG family protein n=1 Tax=Cellvibrio sp. TaxID=1965322 RepID=UPI0031A4B3D3
MLYPMFVMVILTLLVAINLFRVRYKAIKAGEVRLSQFRLNTGVIPDKITQAANNYSNLFEIPMLFYIACATAIALGIQTPIMVFVAWVFVVARVIHSLIHLTSNNVIFRLYAYVLGNICVLILWVLLIASYASR